MVLPALINRLLTRWLRETSDVVGCARVKNSEGSNGIQCRSVVGDVGRISDVRSPIPVAIDDGYLGDAKFSTASSSRKFPANDIGEGFRMWSSS